MKKALIALSNDFNSIIADRVHRAGRYKIRHGSPASVVCVRRPPCRPMAAGRLPRHRKRGFACHPGKPSGTCPGSIVHFLNPFPYTNCSPSTFLTFLAILWIERGKTVEPLPLLAQSSGSSQKLSLFSML